MDNFLYPIGGATQIATLVKAGMANATVHLLKDQVTITKDTVLADLTPHEADVDGYAAATVVTWTGPYQDPLGGSSIRSGEIDFHYVAAMPPVVDNNAIWGFYVLKSTGELIVAATFGTPGTLGVSAILYPLTVVLNYGRNP